MKRSVIEGPEIHLWKIKTGFAQRNLIYYLNLTDMILIISFFNNIIYYLKNLAKLAKI